jgi:hypothetical protein
MNNEGLKALAAIASAAPPGEDPPPPQDQNGAAPLTASLPVVSNGQTGAASLPGQQWQQAVTPGSNQASLTAANLALLNMQQLPQSPDVSTLMAMQQMNYFNFLLQAQSAQQMMAPAGLNGFANQNQALQLMLSGLSTNPLLKKPGMCLIVVVCHSSRAHGFDTYAFVVQLCEKFNYDEKSDADFVGF